MNLPHCSECRYFVPGHRISTEQHDGSCHFSTPGNYSTPHPDSGTTDDSDEYGNGTTLLTFVDNTYTGWPIVLATDWCGCHDPLPRTRKPKERP